MAYASGTYYAENRGRILERMRLKRRAEGIPEWDSPEARSKMGDRRRGSARWQEVISYLGAHQRTRNERGLASDQVCEHCGGPAEDWALDHASPTEQFRVQEPGRWPEQYDGRTYSLDPDDYIALCRSCHYKFDKETLDEAR